MRLLGKPRPVRWSVRVAQGTCGHVAIQYADRLPTHCRQGYSACQPPA
ncbi:hypothetical protein thalar_01452 [Litoreibacter arenae DSM 19593]|uniref:Uncharacterized protein n=1 Tax=Litoreibacter arenae DSM 19593 TaxID=1123360 RepID=S9S1P7_9RHOB|nr:hypothetical protein thalar_01452 [Litoreibacter arenae DSM 19593]